MNKDCEAIQKVIDAIEKGANADDVIPYSLIGFSKECIKEFYMIYLKYGIDENRKNIVRRGLKELDNES